jgi:hypothetical protein
MAGITVRTTQQVLQNMQKVGQYIQKGVDKVNERASGDAHKVT